MMLKQIRKTLLRVPAIRAAVEQSRHDKKARERKERWQRLLRESGGMVR